MKHGIAVYPKKWRDFLVSENKICIQFDDCQAKTRIQRNKEGYPDHEGLLKAPLGAHSLPVSSHGTDIEFIAVGIPMQIHMSLFHYLLKSYVEHYNTYGDERVRHLISDIAFEADLSLTKLKTP